MIQSPFTCIAVSINLFVLIVLESEYKASHGEPSTASQGLSLKLCLSRGPHRKVCSRWGTHVGLRTSDNRPNKTCIHVGLQYSCTMKDRRLPIGSEGNWPQALPMHQ